MKKEKKKPTRNSERNKEKKKKNWKKSNKTVLGSKIEFPLVLYEKFKLIILPPGCHFQFSQRKKVS